MFQTNFKLVQLKLLILCSKATFILALVNRSQVLNLVTHQLSVAVHTMRSIQFHAMKNAQV